jgi:hypothetical protein
MVAYSQKYNGHIPNMGDINCSICSSLFTEDGDGLLGEIGIIPVAFCPTCLGGLHEMAHEIWGIDDDDEEEFIVEFYPTWMQH